MKQVARYIVMVVIGALFLGTPVCRAVEVKLHVSVVSRKSTDTINDFGFTGVASELAGVDAMQKNPKVLISVSDDGAGDALLPRLSKTIFGGQARIAEIFVNGYYCKKNSDII